MYEHSLCQVIITALGAAFIDRAGRKPLLVVNSKFSKATHATNLSCIIPKLRKYTFFKAQISGAGLVLGCLLTGSSFFMKVKIYRFYDLSYSGLNNVTEEEKYCGAGAWNCNWCSSSACCDGHIGQFLFVSYIISININLRSNT